MKPISTFLLGSFLTLGLAGSRLAEASDGAVQRGQIKVPAATTKGVVVGPTAIRAYSAFSGADLYVVDAVSGTDRDCQAGAGQAVRTTLPADRVETFRVRAGQLVCVASTGGHTIELLWHTEKVAAAPATLARR
jgi:hypothetical protein